MKEYRVYFTVSTKVKANNFKEAKKVAREMVRTGKIDSVEWEFTMGLSGYNKGRSKK